MRTKTKKLINKIIQRGMKKKCVRMEWISADKGPRGQCQVTMKMHMPGGRVYDYVHLFKNDQSAKEVRDLDKQGQDFYISWRDASDRGDSNQGVAALTRRLARAVRYPVTGIVGIALTV